MSSRRRYLHVYAVIRYHPDADLREDAGAKITVKEVLPTMELAEAEANRLNGLARGGDRYFWTVTRWPVGLALPGR